MSLLPSRMALPDDITGLGAKVVPQWTDKGLDALARDLRDFERFDFTPPPTVEAPAPLTGPAQRLLQGMFERMETINRLGKLVGLNKSKNADRVFDKWVWWTGGDCPVQATDCVSLLFRDGKTLIEVDADGWLWHPVGADSDIVAYKILSKK